MGSASACRCSTVARRLGVSVAVYRQLEAGTMMPSWEAFDRIRDIASSAFVLAASRGHLAIAEHFLNERSLSGQPASSVRPAG